jgi:hypothetical protein
MINAFSLGTECSVRGTDIYARENTGCLTQKKPQGRTRDTAHRPVHKYTQSEHGSKLQRAQAEQGASSFCFAQQWNQKSNVKSKALVANPRTHEGGAYLSVCPRADVRRYLHHVRLTLALHAAQDADMRRKWHALEWANAIEVCLGVRLF